MLSCINISSSEFQRLRDASGLPEHVVEAYCRSYSDMYGRFPYLDEIPGADSLPFLKKEMNLSSNNTTSVNDFLKFSQASDIKQGIINLNDEFRDLEIDAMQIGDKVKLFIYRKPSQYQSDNADIEEIEQEENLNSAFLIGDAINKLADLYGINLIAVTQDEIEQNDELIQLGASTAKAFVYNNNIYINVDNADIDSPLHEMLHMFFGSMRFTNPDLYYQTVQLATQFPSFDFIAKQYKNRTMGDLCEEVFITEFAKYLSGKESDIPNLPKEVQHEIFYNTKRILDIILIGDYSVKEIEDKDICNFTLRSLSEFANSHFGEASYKGSLDDAEISRIMANLKMDLVEKGELEEECFKTNSFNSNPSPVKDLVGGARRNARDPILFRENLRSRYPTDDPEVFRVNGKSYSDNYMKGRPIDELHNEYIAWAKSNNLY